MPRRPKIEAPNNSLHIIQRRNNKQACFFADNEQEQSTYRELFRYELEPDEIDQIRKTTNGNFSLGTKRFQDEISIILGRRAFPGIAGRPRTKK